MTNPPMQDGVALRHALNNQLGKIMGAAELALDCGVSPEVGAELRTILRLAEEMIQLTDALGTAKGSV